MSGAVSAAPTKVAVLDYGMGNRRSVQKALQHLGAQAEITSHVPTLRAADGLVVPGVGAFPQAMANLRRQGLDDVIRRQAEAQVPVLGVCLGMQLLFDRSLELGHTPGLGLIAGEVTPLCAGGQRLPHIGWNHVRWERDSVLIRGLPAGGCPFYHVHSLAARPVDPAVVVGTTEYGERFATIVARGPILGVQFHPEKSSRHGLQMLSAFLALCAGRRGAVAGAAAGAAALRA